MPAETYRLFVERVEFYAYHGFSDEEQAIGHRYVLSLDAKVAGSAHQSDALADTVDYGALVDICVGVATRAQHRLMESLVLEIGREALAAFPLIRVLTVSLAKVNPPIAHVAAEAGIALTMTPGDFL